MTERETAAEAPGRKAGTVPDIGPVPALDAEGAKIREEFA